MSAPTRLAYTFDVARLLADLAVCDAHEWLTRSHLGWLCHVLRSSDGSVGNMEPSATARDAPLLGECPYFREVLKELGQEFDVGAARVSSLVPGGEIQPHTDAHCVPWRIHIPITTNTQSVIQFNAIDYHWKPGEAWLADFGYPHAAWNRGKTRRVHLLVNVARL